MIRYATLPGVAIVARQRRLRQAAWLAALVASLVVLGLTLMAILPRALGYSTFIVYGGSMEPSIREGSVVVAKPVSIASVRAGDIILFRPSDSRDPVMHRVVSVRDTEGKLFFTLKGDANDTADPKELELSGRGSKVIYALPLIGYLFDFAGSGLGRMIAIVLPTLFLTCWALRGIWTTKEARPTAG